MVGDELEGSNVYDIGKGGVIRIFEGEKKGTDVFGALGTDLGKKEGWKL